MSHSEVTCPDCNCSLDLSGLASIPAQVRCGQCGRVFSTEQEQSQAAEPQRSAVESPAERNRWKGDDQVEPDPATGALPSGAAASPLNVVPSHLRPAAGAETSPHNVTQNESGGQDNPLSGVAAADANLATAKSGIQIQLGENDSQIAKRTRKRGINAAWILAASVLILVVSVTTVAGLYLAGIISLEANLGSSGDVIVVDQNAPADGSEDKPITWIDASRFSARMAGIKVKIQRVEMGEVRARDENRLIQRSEDDSFLQVFLIVENQRRLNVAYTSWYGNQFTVKDKKRIATMSAGETPFTMLLFSDAFDINGHTPMGDLEEKEELRDTIVFEIPPEVDVKKMDKLRLELPGAAFGETGTLHFEIPVSMIKSAQERGSLLDESELINGGLPLRPDDGDNSDDE